MLKEKRRRLEEEGARLEAAAVRVQVRFRTWRCRNLVAQGLRRRRERERAAVRLQAQWRARTVRLDVGVRIAILQAQREEDSAKKIQNALRGRQARNATRAEKARQAERAALERRAALSERRKADSPCPESLALLSRPNSQPLAEVLSGAQSSVNGPAAACSSG